MPADRVGSPWRWVLAVVIGWVVWYQLQDLAPTGSGLLGNLISVAVAIVVVGLIVGARSVRQWLTVALVVGGLAAIVVALFVLLFTW